MLENMLMTLKANPFLFLAVLFFNKSMVFGLLGFVGGIYFAGYNPEMAQEILMYAEDLFLFIKNAVSDANIEETLK